MKFKNYEEYMAMRNSLLKEAETMMNEGKVEDATEKMKEVESIDNDWDEFAKAQANF